MSFENAAGLGVRNHYGPRSVNDKFGGQTSTGGFYKTAEWVFDYNDLPVNGPLSMEALIPAGAFIQSGYLEVVEPMTGTSGTLTVGLEEGDGSIVDIDGIVTAAAGVQAALGANDVVVANGALIGTGIGVDAQLLVTSGGTVSGGKFKVVIEYAQGDFDGAGTYVAGGVKGN